MASKKRPTGKKSTHSARTSAKRNGLAARPRTASGKRPAANTNTHSRGGAKSAPPAANSTAKTSSRSRYRYRRVGIVPLESGVIADQPARLRPTSIARARPHVIKFHGPGDAVNVHASAANGTILYAAQLRLVFWGREWAGTSAPVAMARVTADVHKILNGPYLLSLLQYGVSGATLDRVIDLSTEDPPNPVDDIDIQDLVGRLIDNGTVPEPDQDLVPAIYAVFLPTRVQGHELAHPAARGSHGFMSSIDWDDFNYAYVPVMWVGNEGTPSGITSVFSHELVETLTDPEGDGWQIDPRDRDPPQEIADVCKSQQGFNGVLVQSYWSNEDMACIVPIRAYTIYAVQWIWRPDRIEWLGGVDEDQTPWQLPRQAVMDRIREGDAFRVYSGNAADVSIFYLDATHPYLATVPDGTPDDNLLALPQRPPS